MVIYIEKRVSLFRGEIYANVHEFVRTSDACYSVVWQTRWLEMLRASLAKEYTRG